MPQCMYAISSFQLDHTHVNVVIVTLQLWARVYRDDHYHIAVDTNNGVETMNKTLKYNYLPKGKNITGIITSSDNFGRRVFARDASKVSKRKFYNVRILQIIQ